MPRFTSTIAPFMPSATNSILRAVCRTNSRLRHRPHQMAAQVEKPHLDIRRRAENLRQPCSPRNPKGLRRPDTSATSGGMSFHAPPSGLPLGPWPFHARRRGRQVIEPRNSGGSRGSATTCSRASRSLFEIDDRVIGIIRLKVVQTDRGGRFGCFKLTGQSVRSTTYPLP